LDRALSLPPARLRQLHRAFTWFWIAGLALWVATVVRDDSQPLILVGLTGLYGLWFGFAIVVLNLRMPGLTLLQFVAFMASLIVLCFTELVR
jgi:hypothetical protein